jgi:D-3-phosphoglycerate dehydrogenase
MDKKRSVAILANDGIEETAKQELIQRGFVVYDQKVPEVDLASFVNDHGIQVLIVRSATKVKKEFLEKVSGLKLIIRAGVGVDNIDVEAAKRFGIEVRNTPLSSSRSVAELVFAHLFAIARSLHLSNRKMPVEGTTHFAQLKKQFSTGFELQGKTIGILGIGRIGKEVARYAIGLGMHPIAYDPYVKKAEVEIQIVSHTLRVEVPLVELDTLLQESDVITIHVPGGNGKPLIGAKELAKMKPGAILINTARGSVVDEEALLQALETKRLQGAGLDVFENEPYPNPKLLTHDAISVSPHIGASTVEAQKRIGEEIVALLDQYFLRQ